jgi:hypothetical protein
VAYHEAGHFIVGRAVGRSTPFGITIDREGGTYGAVNGDLGLPPEPQPSDYAALITELYAGFAAHIRLFPGEAELARSLSWDDDEQAQAEVAKLSELLGRESLEGELRARAEGLVRDHWAEIEALAAALMEHPTLEGDEAELIALAASGDLEAATVLKDLRALKAG